MIRDGKLGVSGEDEMTGSDRCRAGEAWGNVWTLDQPVCGVSECSLGQ